MLHFTTPWALLLLVLLPATALFGWQRLRRLSPRRAALALVARLLVLALVVVALAGPEWQTRDARVAVMFLVDSSASVGSAGQKAAMQWAVRASRSAGPHDQAGMILFGAAPRLAVPLAHYGTMPDPTTGATGATDVAAALRLGAAMIPPNTVGRLVLLSDGRATTGNTTGALALALSRGLPIDTVAMAPRLRDVSVRSLDVPSTVRAGDDVDVRVVLHSTVATTATLSLDIDGAEGSKVVSVPAGDTVLATQQRIDQPGLHTFRASIDAPGDQMRQNDALDAVTVAGPPGRVLFVVNDPSSATGLAGALARSHLTLKATLPANAPTSGAAYRAYDEVVLDNVPASTLSRAQQRALRGAVHDQGLGLLVVGGSDAFGNGGYAHTPLEDALPVYSISTPHRVSAPVALMLVIDKSGSMADSVAGVAKMDMVKIAAASALDKLNVGDAIGVLAFDDVNHVIVPFHILQGDADKAQIRREISTLSADGDTYIYPALREAERDVLRVPTPFRHIVLLTDGQGEDAPFDAMIRRMRHEHITLSTIGVGTDVVRDELQHWANLGGGRFHYVADPHQIPRIVINETRYGASGSALVHGHIKLSVASASPLLRSLAGQKLPAISGYDSTTPKTTAQVSVQTASGDPVLSSWQYGLGRVAAWSSDAGTEWATAWSATKIPSFWSDAAHWVLRGYTQGTRVPTLDVQDGTLQVSAVRHTASGGFDDTASPRVRLVMPDGGSRGVALALSGPGTYTARVDASTPGIYSAAFSTNDHPARSPSDVAALAVPYGAEYNGDGVDSAFLTHLSGATGGRTLARPADAFSHAGLPLTINWLPLWPFLLGLALLLFPVDVGLRLLVPPDPLYRRRSSQ